MNFEVETFVAELSPVLCARANSGGGLGTDHDLNGGLIAYRTTGNSGAYETGDRVDALTTSTDKTSHVLAYAMTTGIEPKASADLAFTLITPSSSGGGQPQAVAFAQNTRDEVRLFNDDGQIVGALSSERGAKQQSYIAQQFTVRRLTPTECERLQGFPEGYTAIAWRGKGADQCPDGPRYKALGNSMAVLCMRWIGERLQAAMPERKS
jgi:DNA (cytosine-5)-methyltransferase 1